MQDSPIMTVKGTLYKLLWILITGFGIYLALPSRPLDLAPANLDGSWRIALQVAHDRGLVFGRDFIFTYGPLGFLSARTYADSTRWLILAYDVFVALQLPLLCLAVYRRSRAITSLINLFGVLFVLSSAIYFMDPPIVLFLLSTFWLYDCREDRSKLKFLLALINALLSFYIKVNLGLAAIGQLFVTMLLDTVNPDSRAIAFKRLLLAGLMLTGSLLLIPVDLYNYIRASLHIANGYNDAMYLDFTNPNYLFWALCVLGALAAAIVISVARGRLGLLGLSCAGFAFLLFKQSFVRSDDHIWEFFDYIPFCFALLSLFTQRWVRFINGSLLTLVIGFSIYQNKMPLEKLPVRLASEKYTALTKYASSYTLLSETAQPKPPLPAQLASQVGKDSIDLMPDNIGILYYNHLNYIPRPVIQSYTSYDHYLDRINYDYLLHRGPEYMHFSHGCIDYRYCLHEDTEAKLALLRRYNVVLAEQEFVLLKRNPEERSEKRELIASGRLRLGDKLPIPQDGTLKVAEFDIRYSFIGALRRALFKPHALKMTIASKGQKNAYRAIVPIVNGGVIVSHNINNHTTIQDFFRHNFSALPPIDTVRLHSDHSTHFNRYFDYRIYRITFE